jgi:hypothetical protein
MTTNAINNMNASQRRAFSNVRDFVTMHGHYEIKEMTVHSFEDGSDVYVTIETGMPNDEGTMAELVCRDNYGFFIGARGGIFTYNDNSERVYHKYYNVPNRRF